MSHQTIDIIFGVLNQALTFDAPEGRPSSITASQVFEYLAGDDTTEEDALGSSALVEANPSTTISAASGLGQANPRTVNLTATTGIAPGRSYLAKNAAGASDWVEAMSVTPGVSILAREALQNTYAAADTFVSTRVTQNLSTEWVEDKNKLSDPLSPNARWRWRLVYVVDSATYVHDLYFDLLRYAGRHDVSPLDVDRRAPGWIDRLPPYYREDQGRSVVAEAYRVVKFDLMNLSTADQSIRNREVMNELVTLKAVEMVDVTEINAKRYADRLNQLIAWGKTETQADSSGGSATANARPIWRR